jgi:hypothetical protein
MGGTIAGAIAIIDITPAIVSSTYWLVALMSILRVY